MWGCPEQGCPVALYTQLNTYLNIDLNRVDMYVSMRRFHFVRLRKYHFVCEIRKEEKEESPLQFKHVFLYD